MILLLDFSVIKPEFGLIFWTTLLFGVFFLLLRKYAFAPIAQALKDREDSIDTAIQSAEQARAEMRNLTAQNDQIMRQAQEEKSVITKRIILKLNICTLKHITFASKLAGNGMQIILKVG